MARTQLSGNQINDGTVERIDLNITTPGQAIIRKVIAGNNITLESTGVDTGTGDVIVHSTGGGGGIIETNPVFTYTNGLITRIDYDSGNYKILSYIDGVLVLIDYIIGLTTKRKTFNFNTDGYLISIVETEL